MRREMIARLAKLEERYIARTRPAVHIMSGPDSEAAVAIADYRLRTPVEVQAGLVVYIRRLVDPTPLLA